MDILTLKKAQKYTDKKAQEIKLKISQIEKELDNYQQTMAMVNINQEPKQTATGYGTVTFPPNAANGQVSASVKGRTLKNELNYNRDTMAEWSVAGNSTKSTDTLNLAYGGSPSPVATLPTALKPSTKYGFLYYKASSGNNQLQFTINSAFPDYAVLHNQTTDVGYRKAVLTTRSSIINNDIRIYTSLGTVGDIQIIKYLRAFELPVGSEIETDFNTLTADQLAQKYSYISGDSTKSTIGACRLRSVSEDESEESAAYIIAKDENGNVAELRSLPNGTKDEVRVSGGKAELIKRVSGEYIIPPNPTLAIRFIGENNEGYSINLPNFQALPMDGRIEFCNNHIKEVLFADRDLIENRGNFYTSTHISEGLVFIFEKGLTSEQRKEQIAGLELIYQLAEPIITPINVSGTLLSNPNGTVYVENAVADAGLYTDKITVLQQDLPIRELEKIARVDFVTGQETELDTTQAVISTDKLSFTHPDLADGDIVFFTYFYDRESTLGEVTLEYYDSRYTIKDTANEKFYQWKIISTNGTPSIALVEV